MRQRWGNTRITFGTKTYTAVSYQSDDYYPFGMEISNSTNSPKNEYLYNKKELQEELQQYDYGARFYDAVIGRWGTIDPLSEKSRRWSPYNYVEDDPIRHTDPNGMECNSCGGAPIDHPEYHRDNSHFHYIAGGANVGSTNAGGSTTPQDWVRDKKTGRVYNDTKVKGPGDVNKDQEYVGKTDIAFNRRGDELYLAADGKAYTSVQMDEVVINGNAKEEDPDVQQAVAGTTTGESSVELLTEKLKKAGNLAKEDAGLLGNLKYLGTGIVVLSTVRDSYSALNNFTPGNALKVVWDLAAAAFGPAGGIVDGIADGTGLKTKASSAIDRAYENHISNAIREASEYGNF